MTDPNYEDEAREIESSLYLTHIVDLEGFNLLVHKSTFIPEGNLLQTGFFHDREPDTQRGGEYWGNQHAEIDKFFNDSVSALDSQIEICLTPSFSTTGHDHRP